MKKDFLTLFYNILCEEFLRLEKEYSYSPSPQRRKEMIFLRSQIYKIDVELQER